MQSNRLCVLIITLNCFYFNCYCFCHNNSNNFIKKSQENKKEATMAETTTSTSPTSVADATTTTIASSSSILPLSPKKCSQDEKMSAIQSNWWHVPMQTLFPDKRFDGQFQNPDSEQLFDFDDVIMKADDPISFIQSEETNVIYYPPDDDKNLFTIFIPGLGQTEATASYRSCRYAKRLNTGIANLNNGSFLKQNPVLTKVNPFLDWLDATIHRLGLSGSLVIDNCATFLVTALKQRQVMNISADSHGTILLGRALWLAKAKFMEEQLQGEGCIVPILGGKDKRQQAEQEWERVSHQCINVICFGNGYMNWVKGPKYVMVNISTDPLVKYLGMTPERAQKRNRTDIACLVFESIFAEGNFEAHNMMYTIELLRQTFIKNELVVGDFSALYKKLLDGSLNVVTAAEALSTDFPWPDDMKDYTWGTELPVPGQEKEETKEKSE